MQGNEFETVTVKVGTVDAQGDYRKSKRFLGKELAFVRTFEHARSRDDRGVDYTLYQRPDKTYLVYINEWTKWQGEYDEYYVVQVSNDEELADKYPALANKAGIEVVEDLDTKDLDAQGA